MRVELNVIATQVGDMPSHLSAAAPEAPTQPVLCPLWGNITGMQSIQPAQSCAEFAPHG